MIITSNRSPNEWPALFGDPLLASAGLDRLTDAAEVVVIRGPSYRARGRAQFEQAAAQAFNPKPNVRQQADLSVG